jgi:molecular chaperone GrpE
MRRRAPDPFGSPFFGPGLFDPWGRRPGRPRREADEPPRRRRYEDPRVELERRRRADLQRRPPRDDRWEDGGPLDPRAPRPPASDQPTPVVIKPVEPREARPPEAPAVAPAPEPESPPSSGILDETTVESALSEPPPAPASVFDESSEIARVRERLERSAAIEAEAQRRGVIADMLDVLDDLDRALAAGDEASAALVKGVSLVRDNFLRKLERHGVTRGDDAPGMRFDPERHTAIGTVPVAREDDGDVVEVLGPAYFTGDELLRPAQVIVGRAS